MLAQAYKIVNFSDLTEATLKVEEFINIRADKQILSFTLVGYFYYILIMGILLTTGAGGTIARRRWGFYLLWIYISQCMLHFLLTFKKSIEK